MQSCFPLLLQFITKANSFKNGTGGKKKIVSFSQALPTETIQTAHWDGSGNGDLAVSLSHNPILFRIEIHILGFSGLSGS